MGERKVLNKYIPSDFDPSLVPRGKALSKKDGTVPVRMMLPFSVQCSTCKTFLYRGTKFNSKKEPMSGPNGRYLGIQRYRFYIKCTLCSRTLSFLTDPKNTDYEMEHGGTRTYEVHKDKEKTEEEIALEKEQKEKEDPMKALETRVLESQREMKELDDLEEIRAMNRKHLQLLDVDAVLDAKHGKVHMNTIDVSRKVTKVLKLNEHGITEEEEMLVESIRFGRQNNIEQYKKTSKGSNSNKNKTPTILRLNENDEKREEERRRDIENDQRTKLLRKEKKSKNAILKVKVKNKRKKNLSNSERAVNSKRINSTKMLTVDEFSSRINEEKNNSNGLVGLLSAYGSSSDSE